MLGLLAIASAYSYRRRRMQRFGVNNTNYAGASNVNYYPGGYPPSPYNGYNPNAPQYPPQSYNGYNPQAGFAPVRHKHPRVCALADLNTVLASPRVLHLVTILRRKARRP